MKANGYNYENLKVDPNDYEKILYGTSCVLLPLRGIINSFVYLVVDKHIRNIVKRLVNKSQKSLTSITSSAQIEDFDAKRINKISINSFLSELDSGMIRTRDALSDDETTSLLPSLRGTPTKQARIGISTPMTPNQKGRTQ